MYTHQKILALPSQKPLTEIQQVIVYYLIQIHPQAASCEQIAEGCSTLLKTVSTNKNTRKVVTSSLQVLNQHGCIRDLRKGIQHTAYRYNPLLKCIDHLGYFNKGESPEIRKIDTMTQSPSHLNRVVEKTGKSRLKQNKHS